MTLNQLTFIRYLSMERECYLQMVTFLRDGIRAALKKAKFLSDVMSHIIVCGRWSDITDLNAGWWRNIHSDQAHHFHKSPPLDPIACYFVNIRFNVTLPSTSRFHKLSLSAQAASISNAIINTRTEQNRIETPTQFWERF
jgi:hypothetical protein